MVAVEEHEEREDQRCQEVRELEPLVTYRSVDISVEASQQDRDRFSTYLNGEIEANVRYPCAMSDTTPVQ
jgi:hypothetical protein